MDAEKKRGKVLVSVIVPVYNGEKYVARCMKSIIAQTYRNLEIIVINDGSTDKTEEIIDNLASMDQRIRVFTQNNQGQSAVREKGVRIAGGEYISFVDADDYIAPYFIERLLETGNYGADLMQCGYVMGKDTAYQFVESGEKQEPGKCSGPEFLRKYFDKEVDGLGGMLPIKLYKRKLFEDVHFPPGRIHEDVSVLYRLIYKAREVAYTSEKLYYYYSSENSTMRKAFSLKRLDWATAFEEKLEFLKGKQEISLYNRSLQEYEAVLFKLYYNVKRYFSNETLLKNELKRKIRQTYGELKDKCEIGFGVKCLFCLGQLFTMPVGCLLDKMI